MSLAWSRGKEDQTFLCCSPGCVVLPSSRQRSNPTRCKNYRAHQGIPSPPPLSQSGGFPQHTHTLSHSLCLSVCLSLFSLPVALIPSMESRASQNTHCNRCARYVLQPMSQKSGLGKPNHWHNLNTQRNNRQNEQCKDDGKITTYQHCGYGKGHRQESIRCQQ